MDNSMALPESVDLSLLQGVLGAVLPWLEDIQVFCFVMVSCAQSLLNQGLTEIKGPDTIILVTLFYLVWQFRSISNKLREVAANANMAAHVSHPVAGTVVATNDHAPDAEGLSDTKVNIQSEITLKAPENLEKETSLSR
jgi:hypothetical protein